MNRLRQVDVKAEHFERQVQRAEQERDQWEQKHEVCIHYFCWSPYADYWLQKLHAEYKQSQKELDELNVSLGSL